jgi:DNA polymerase-3 subunit chi
MSCQVNFYVLQSPRQSAFKLACNLVLKAWSQGRDICVAVSSDNDLETLDELMWGYPEGRFIPHRLASDGQTGEGTEPIMLGTMSQIAMIDPPRAILVNLTPETVTEPDRYDRVLEIVPFSEGDRTASRDKFKSYKKLGLDPATHEMNYSPDRSR